ncbi:Protein cortex [Frankliniella fusca]|uniref:Protein cortex n=1 Tax=Frankliniella fusca TaxID=407009 RepID=A0AAE1H015_9NEOP|nr:Protein cortex [Frankliniella fusca]
MAPKYILVIWTKSKKISVVHENSVVKSFGENGEETPICEGTNRMVVIGDKRYEAKILRLCSSKKYLESLVVTKEGEILLHGAKPPCKELLAQKSKLQDDDPEEHGSSDRNILKPVTSNNDNQQVGRRGVTDCTHGCPGCCSGSLPPFPALPDGFVNTLVSLAEYFQQFQKTTADKTVVPSVPPMSKNPNTWQWPSREKIELKKGSGVWIDAMKLEKILGQADITKKPPHQTLVKSLLLDLMGIDKYVETSAEKIDRRLISAIVGFTNDKYPDLAQPIERYYRCINLNRGYMQKRKNEGVFGFGYDEPGDTTVRTRRSESTRSSRRFSDEVSGPRPKRGRKSSNFHKETPSITDSNSTSNIDDSDQLVIPLDCESDEEIPILSSNSVNSIFVVPSSNTIPSNSASHQGNSMHSTSQPSGKLTRKSSGSNVEVYDVNDDGEEIFAHEEPLAVKTEPDFSHLGIEGALDLDFE